jgi:uncharacterized membrane protein
MRRLSSACRALSPCVAADEVALIARPRRVLGKDRMEGFSDGVYGFAATLLVVDLALRPPGTPLERVLHAWPGYLAYLVSFLTIGVSWLLHTALTGQLTGTDQLFLRLNLLVLLVVVFLPFPTGLIADALRHADISGGRVYVTLYGLTLLAIYLLGRALDAYARHEHLYPPVKPRTSICWLRQDLNQLLAPHVAPGRTQPQPLCPISDVSAR